MLSQWLPAPFIVESIEYATAEHFMMAQKALLFGDGEAFTNIVSSPTPSEAKTLGRAVKGFDEAKWASHRFDIAYRGNLAKFSQHDALRRWLLATENKVLVEASPNDVIWGIGLHIEHVDVHVPELWRGLNLLGFVLMKVRRVLKVEDKELNETVTALGEAWSRVMRLQCVTVDVAERGLAALTNLTDPPKYYLSYRTDLIAALHRVVGSYSSQAPYMRGPQEEATAREYASKFNYLLDRIVQRKCDPS